MATEKRLRVSFDAKDEVVRRAIYIAAAMKGVSHNDIINELVEEHLKGAMTLARQAIADDEPTPRAKRKPAGES